MADNSTASHINFNAPATFRKWPSLNNQRRPDARPYLLVDDTLDECIRQFLTKPVSTRHLYEIHTLPQPPLVGTVLSAEIVGELGHLRDFSDRLGFHRKSAVSSMQRKRDIPD